MRRFDEDLQLAEYFGVSLLDFEKHKSFTLAITFLVSFLLRHGKLRFPKRNCSYRAVSPNPKFSIAASARLYCLLTKWMLR